MGVLANARAEQEAAQQSTVENGLFYKFRIEHPELDADADVNLIRRAILADGKAVTAASITEAVEVLQQRGRLAVRTPEDIQAERTELVDAIIANQYPPRKAGGGKHSLGDSQHGNKSYTDANISELNCEKRQNRLLSTDLPTLRALATAETRRSAIIERKVTAQLAGLDPRAMVGGQGDLQYRKAYERERLAHLDIEELLRIEQELDFAAAHAEKSTAELSAEVKPMTSSTLLLIPGEPEEQIVNYSRRELIAMDRAEFNSLFKRPDGSWKPGYEVPVKKILNGEEPESVKARTAYLKSHITA